MTDAATIQSHSESTPRHIASLDGLRAIAILMVMVFHFTPAALKADPVGAYIYPLIRTGWAGVDLFFVLSGYLITDILLRARGLKGYFLNFYARRALRIFPLYYAVLAVTLLLIPAVFHDSIDNRREGKVIASGHWLWIYATNIVQAIRGELVFSRGWLNLAHFWSLAVEEHFYFVWPALVAVFSRRQMIGICIVLIAVAIFCRVLLTPPPGAPATANYLAAYVLTPCRMDALAMGGLVALLIRTPRGIDALRRPAMIACGVAAAMLLTFFVRTKSLYYSDHFIQTFGYTVIAILFASLLVFALLIDCGSVFYKFPANRVVGAIARYSYGMYVFHLLLQPAFNKLFPLATLLSLLGTLGGVAVHVVGCCVLTFFVAAVSWHAFEQWFLRLKPIFRNHASTTVPT